MSADFGFNFRGTSGYVTDGLNETYVLGLADTYPTLRGGVTFGWVTLGAGGVADRNNALDRRLAGVNFGSGAPTSDFRVDLPASGAYVIHLGLGDAGGGSGGNHFTVVVKDDTTPVLTLTSILLVSNQTFDATGTSYPFATWAANEVGVTKTFASTICHLTIHEDASSFWEVQHLRLVQVGTASLPFVMQLGAQRI